MSLTTYIQRLEFADSLISKKATGNLTTFALKLKISKSQTMEFLKEMKHLGFPIKYCRKRNSYYYSEDGKFVQNLFERKDCLFENRQNELSFNQLRKISGGKAFSPFFVRSDYIGMSDSNFV